MRPRVFRSKPSPETDAVARAKAELGVEDDLRALAEERRRPGVTHVVNNTGQPERVLTRDEAARLA